MSEWKKGKLGEVCKIRSGKRLPKGHDFSSVPTEFKYIRARDIKNGVINGNDLVYITKDTQEKIAKYIVEVNDIVITIVGASVGDVAYVTSQFQGVNLTENAVRLTEFAPNVDTKYAFYVLNSPEYYGIMQRIAGGAAQPKLGIYKVEAIELPLPPLATQHRIATILSRYDSLIENYQKQIKLLEEAAQRLYKEWFIDLHFPGHENTNIIDGVPEGWEKKSVGQIGEYLNGFAFKPSDWQETGKPIIKIKEMGNGVTNDTPRNNGERVPVKYLIKAGDLLFSWSATLMVIIWSGEEGWLNQHLFKVTPANGISREFLLQSISNTIVEFQNLTTGSTMKHIQRNKLDQVFVNVPNAKIMKRYADISEKTRSSILSLQSQLRLLTEARDRLLPKLMSGEIEV